MKRKLNRSLAIIASMTLAAPLFLTASNRDVVGPPSPCWDKYWTTCNGGLPTRNITTTYNSTTRTNSWGGSAISINIPNAANNGNPVPQMRIGSTYKEKIRGRFSCVYVGDGVDQFGTQFFNFVAVLKEDGEMDGAGGFCN
jgi:hypothetical protein